MKKIIEILISMLMLAGMLSACANTSGNGNSNASNVGVSNTGNPESSEENRISVVTTIFPEYDWVREIVGGRIGEIELTMLLDNGVDLHSYQPTADDLVKISNCDLFLYVGGESDEWAEDALKQAGNPDMVAVKLLDALGDAVKEEEYVEGMEQDEHGESEEGQEEEPEYDEHVWLSLKNAKALCQVIADKISAIDPEHKDEYAANAAAYIEKLSALDSEYQKAVDGAEQKALVFGDRFPFRYLADDYGLDYFAAFAGCSAETEASFETITFLAEKADALGVSCILSIEGAEHKIAETIVSNTSAKDQQILTMDSLQSATMADAEQGETYLSKMQQNLDVLKEALQ